MSKRTLGIVGGGQLGRMLAIAARPLGIRVIVLDPTPESPAGQVADAQVVGHFDKAEDVKDFARMADVMTFEIESAHAEALQEIASARPGSVYPLPQTLSRIRDKYLQKEHFRAHGIPVAPFRSIETAQDIKDAAGEFGYPLILKARHGAYDGRGNARIAGVEDIEPALEKLADRELYVEANVPFIKELAVVAVRSSDGTIVTYPVVETIHENHICHMVIAPAPVDQSVHDAATDLAHRVLQVFEGAGVFGIEMFLTEDGSVLVNEIAPRVHNSGHFTIEACETSQFEQQVRAVMGEPLGSTRMTRPASVMINILGDRTGPADPGGIGEAEALGEVTVHIYGKGETKPQRKMGHITVLAESVPEAIRLANEARARVTI